MTKAQITQCPMCQTTFRVSPEQLQVAKGAVRCGACLHIFNAEDHFQQKSTPITSNKDNKTKETFNSSEGELLIHDDMDESLLLDDIGAIFNDDNMGLIDDTNTGLIDDDTGMGLIDDDTDMGLIDDGEDDNSFSDDLNEEFLSLDTQSSKDPFSANSGHVIIADDEQETEDENWAKALINEADIGDESWAQALVEEDETPAVAKRSAVNAEQKSKGFTKTGIKAALTRQPQQVKKRKEPVTSQPAVDEFDLDTDLSETAALVDKQPYNPSSQFTYFRADPLDLHLPRSGIGGSKWLWFLLAITMALGLLVQLAYFKFDSWARSPDLRPWYRIACTQFGCELPSLFDISQIRTTASPRVSSHPKYQNALSVDILFMNHASFEQPFPKLRLSFTDKSGNAVAKRDFIPKEYLAGEAAGMKFMPSQVPIHIALEIKDPGTNADSYQVSFLENR